jgi:CRISPR/Cas system-associated exonuclease Cas4 (RecB family)
MNYAKLFSDNEEYANAVRDVIVHAGVWTPRAGQVAIGPSEAGHPCTRRLAYKTLDWDKPNEMQGGSWAAQVGTAIHAYLADVFKKREGFLIEQRVQIGQSLAGTVDLFDQRNGVVLDWKTTGANKLANYKRHGADAQHLIQVQLYAYGLAQQGEEVKKVAICYLPTSGSLTDMVLVLHDYDEKVALEALARLNSIRLLVIAADVEKNPEIWSQIPAEPNRLCAWCPYFKPFSKDLTEGCPGDTA